MLSQRLHLEVPPQGSLEEAPCLREASPSIEAPTSNNSVSYKGVALFLVLPYRSKPTIPPGISTGNTEQTTTVDKMDTQGQEVKAVMGSFGELEGSEREKEEELNLTQKSQS